MFGHNKEGKATFKAGQKSESMDSKPKPNMGGDKKPMSQPPNEQHSPEHVTKTHPGMTQPHPSTGVHAFHSMHKGGGKFESHTHHEDGNVEVRPHDNAEDLQAAHQEAMPSDNMGDQAPPDDMNNMEGMMKDMKGIGGGY